MMSTSHSPLHFSNDLNNYMDHMFFSSSLSADDSIDLCTILKTEYDGEIMIGWRHKKLSDECIKCIWKYYFTDKLRM